MQTTVPPIKRVAKRWSISSAAMNTGSKTEQRLSRRGVKGQKGSRSRGGAQEKMEQKKLPSPSDGRVIHRHRSKRSNKITKRALETTRRTRLRVNQPAISSGNVRHLGWSRASSSRVLLVILVILVHASSSIVILLTTQTRSSDTRQEAPMKMCGSTGEISSKQIGSRGIP